jgi:hypothetical protein
LIVIVTGALWGWGVIPEWGAAVIVILLTIASVVLKRTGVQHAASG